MSATAKMPAGSAPMGALVAGLQVATAVAALLPGGIDAWLPVRIVAAGAAVLILPGWLARAATGARSRHYLESLAMSAFLSFAIVGALGVGAMVVQVSIGVVGAALFVLNLALTVVWLRRTVRVRAAAWRPRAGSDWLLLGLICGLAVIAYRWGDDVRAVGWEAALHMAYVRQYASGLPLDFQSAVLRPPEVVAQNYLYLWEFALAVVARASGLDSLVAALKIRWIVPVLGFASFYFMVQRLVSSRAAVRAIWVMVAAVLLQFLTLPPNAYDVYIQSGPLRQVGAFFGSIHHSDSAMEILLPMLVGILFWAIRRGTVANWLMFALALAVAFLWHPREYFQVMWYGGLAILVDLLAGLRSHGRGAWRRRAVSYASMIATYVVVAALLYACMPASIRASSEHAAGLANQWNTLMTFLASLRDTSTWLAGSLPLSFHLHGYEAPGTAPSQAMIFSWMILAIPLAGVLALIGGRRGRWLAFYTLVTWVTSLNSYKFEQLMQSITYHEILISKPRLVHLFAYAVIGLGWTVLVGVLAGSSSRVVAAVRALVGAAILGGLFAWAWTASVPEFPMMFRVLNLAFFVIAAVLLVSLRTPLGALAGTVPIGRAGPLLAGVTFAVFAVGAARTSATERWTVMLAHHPDPAALFGEGNPVGLSPDTIEYFRSRHPARLRLLIEPNQPHMVGIYAPVYAMPLLGNIGADLPQLQAAQQDKDPVFNSATRAGRPDMVALRGFLAKNRIAHILVAGDYVQPFAQLVVDYPAEFSVAFRSADGRNLVVALTRSEHP